VPQELESSCSAGNSILLIQDWLSNYSVGLFAHDESGDIRHDGRQDFQAFVLENSC